MVREFEKRDTEPVMRIWLEGNLEAHPFVPKAYWVSHYRLVQEQLLQADIYVFEQDEKILGFVGMTGDYLAGIFVDKDCRSMGIGKSLLQCVKKKYPAFSLNVFRKNRRAVDFYLREGLTVISEGVDEDTGEADYFMAWNNTTGRSASSPKLR